MAETVTIDRQSCLSTAIEKARDRQRFGTGAAPQLQQDLHRQARSRRLDPAARRRLPARSGYKTHDDVEAPHATKQPDQQISKNRSSSVEKHIPLSPSGKSLT